jgi:hypothetical protein
MSKNAQWMGLTLACALVSSTALAQGLGNPAVAPQATLKATQAAVAASSSTLVPAAAANVIGESSAPSHVDTYRKINENRARLELLKSQAELDKFDKASDSGSGSGSTKDDASGLQAALEQAKKEQAAPIGASVVSVVEQAPSVTLLSTLSMVSSPSSGYAEVKVGDLLVHAQVGDRLPSGDYVRAIDFDSIKLAKSKKSKKTRTVYISATDTASVYGSRGRSGQVLEPASGAQSSMASPSGLPPMPGSR